MLSRRVYYHLKPFVPWRVRLALRQMRAKRILKTCGDCWPILESTTRKPEGWPGWPDGKQFAFVLTHDVESQRGVDRVQQLAELEMSLGYRSSFNFIPEGTYRVPASLREWLVEHGFEVGVHDLHHDGKLYSSREEFEQKAARINGYLKEWKAAGFRSAFMLHNLDWLHSLEVDYEASTFDTDPFEPQPDGAGTIFPFWVPPRRNAIEPASQDGQRANKGYVELPYTLSQDSTLFLILRQQTSEIWRHKLDWVAREGGMALVNIHPDYIDFTGNSKDSREFPVERVRELLEYANKEFGAKAWKSTAKNLAAWFKLSKDSAAQSGSPASFELGGDAQPLAGKHAAILLYSYYPSDPRPRRAAEALAGAGMKVDLVCLRENDAEPEREMINGVQIFRVPLQRKRGSKITYMTQYASFLARSFAFLTRHGWKGTYDLVHVHNMPDVLVFAALVPKIRGAKIILDLHDPMPELMTSIYNLNPGHWAVRLLKKLESWSIGFADLALTPNITFKDLFVSRSSVPEKMEIVMNSPEEEIFDPDRFGPDRGWVPPNGEFRVMHHGSIVHRHGIDLLVEAVARVRPKVPGIRLDIYGSHTSFLDSVLYQARQQGVGDIVHYHGPKPQMEIARAIRECHLGVVPNRRSPFTELNFPTRLFEYLAMDRPVIAPATKGIRDYFGEKELITFEPDNVDDLASKILWTHEQPAAVREIIEGGVRVYRDNLWSGEKALFLNHVTALVNAN